MTQPAQPQAPGAPQATSTTTPPATAIVPAAPGQPAAVQPPATEPVAAVTTPPAAPPTPTEPASTGDGDPWTDPDKAKAEIERLRRENGAARTTAKAQAAEEARNALAQEIGKALGLVKADEPADPAKLAEQVASSTAETRQAKLDLAVFQAATAAGADATALLDSVSFRNKIKTIDPADHLAIGAAIGEAVTASPAFAARSLPRPNSAQGGSGNGVPGNREAANVAEKAGDFKTSAALKSDQLLQLRQQQST